MKNKGSLIAILATLGVFKFYAQSADSMAAKIKLPQNIILDLPLEAGFSNKRGLNPDLIYTLKRVTGKPSIDLFNSRLYNPHAVSRDIKDTADIFLMNKEFEFEANYLTQATDSDFTFIYRNSSKLSDIERFVGIEDTVIYLPSNWRDSIGDAKIKSIWFVAGVRIDSKGNPLEKRNTVDPILIETDRKQYDILGSSIGQSNIEPFLPHIGPTFVGYVLDDCANKETVMKAFTNKVKASIIKKLESPPFGASLYPDFALPENELWLQREHKNSLILGAPFFEISTYILKWEIKNEGQTHAVKFYITHSMTKSTGMKGTYIEPEIQDVKKFKERINALVNSSTKEVCTELQLEYYLNICKCN